MSLAEAFDEIAITEASMESSLREPVYDMMANPCRATQAPLDAALGTVLMYYGLTNEDKPGIMKRAEVLILEEMYAHE